MLRRTTHLLVLTSLFATLLVPFLSQTLSPSAQATESSSLTLTPTLLDPNSSAVALQQLQLPALLDVDVPLSFAATWFGDAAALDAGWEVVYQLRGADGTVAAELISELDLAATLTRRAPGAPEEFWVSSALPAGNYGLSLLVRDPWNGREPLTLGMAGRETDGSYPLGTVEVTPAPVASDISAEGDTPLAADSEAPSELSAPAAVGEYAIYMPMLLRIAEDDPNLGTTGKSRGYLTTPQELRAIKQKADQGRQPYATNVRELLNHSSMSSPTTWVAQSSLNGSVACSDGSQKDSSGNTMPKGPIYLIEGSRQVYGKMLTAILRGGSSGEAYARNARTRILDLVDTTGWGGALYTPDNQCILYLGWYIPGFIQAADLLEAYPTIWTASDKRSFQRWLATQVYPKVAWASRARPNNWGSSGGLTAAMIGDYLWDSGLTLREVEPRSRSLTPGQAYREHTTEQLNRINNVVSSRDHIDGQCLPFKGIQPSGGLPEELRRARISNPLSMCGATYLPSITGGYEAAYNYQTIYLDHMVGHAELNLRRGDRRLYDHIAADQSGSILRAIKFVIANPAKPSASYDWDEARKTVLYVAYRYYRDGAIKDRMYQGEALRSGHTISYGRLTHGFASGESVGSPPTVAPPR